MLSPEAPDAMVVTLILVLLLITAAMAPPNG
jgi:hypothetical protein